MNKKQKKELLSELGRSGGTATYKKHGKKHYQDMVNKRWANAKAKKTEAILPLDKGY